MSPYLFTSERLGFRNWEESDKEAFLALNQDPNVMRHLLRPLSKVESDAMLLRLQIQYIEKSYTYFAVEVLDSKTFIGFIGLSYQDYDSVYTPNVDIGWRLFPKYWGKGYASEGAQRCLDYAFKVLQIPTVIAICTQDNSASEKVMKRIGMDKQANFSHPKLMNYPEQQVCICYTITADI